MGYNRWPRIAEIAISAIAAGVGAWWLRHVTARAVRVWRPGGGEFVRAGRLVARVAGSGEPVFVLLHGLVASGETFGAAYDRLANIGTLVVPGLLGFSRSMDVEREDFALGDHLDALDGMLAHLGLSKARLVVGAIPSAACWPCIGRRVERLKRKRSSPGGAPLFRNEAEGRAQLQKMGMLERVFARNSRFAEKSCELMYAHRQLARAAAVALSPDLPLAVSERVVLHTWPSYRGAVGILFSDWQSALRRIADQNVPVTLVAGTADEAPVPALNEGLAQEYSNMRAAQIEDAAHIVTITHGPACVEHLLSGMAS